MEVAYGRKGGENITLEVIRTTRHEAADLVGAGRKVIGRLHRIEVIAHGPAGEPGPEVQPPANVDDWPAGQ